MLFNKKATHYGWLLYQKLFMLLFSWLQLLLYKLVFQFVFE